MTIKASDLGSGVACLLVAGLLISEGRELGLGELHEPDSGFILFWLGVIMALLAAGLVAGAFLRREVTDADGQPFGSRWLKVPLVLAYLVIYAALLDMVGFIPLTILLLVLLFKTVEPQSWTTSIVGAVVTTAVVYLLFGVALGTQFPAGFLAQG